MTGNKIKIANLNKDFSVGEFENNDWRRVEEISITKYWSGEDAPVGRHFKVKLLWSDTAFYVRFEANQSEPLIVSATPNLKAKTGGLWERDVLEIFVAPEQNDSRKYFEFEIAPNGEWLDLGIYQKPGERITDWDYDSQMQTAARIENDKIWLAMKIEWQAFGKIPQAGDVWLGNLFRCVGAGKARGYLAWSPTETAQPNFHVPTRFGAFEFLN